jgi:hypothetical protein
MRLLLRACALLALGYAAQAAFATCVITVSPNPVISPVVIGSGAKFGFKATGSGCTGTVTWSASAGTVSPTTGTSTVFTAPTETQTTSVTITATVGSAHGSATATVTPAITNGFFGLDINQNNTVNGISSDPWPFTGSSAVTGVNFGVYRTLGSSIKWADLYDCTHNEYYFQEASNPVLTRLNDWLSQAATNGQQVMFTAYYTPSCLSSNPTDSSCAFSAQPGGCDLPSDVTTTDATWITFISDLVTYLNNNFSGYYQTNPIYLEVWNEPDVPSECNSSGGCTAANLAQMTADASVTAKAINSGIKVVSPPPTSVVPSNSPTGDCVNTTVKIAGFLKTYLGETVTESSTHYPVTNYVDIVGFHGYVAIPEPGNTDSGPPYPDPASGASCIGALITNVQSVASAYTSAPIFDTEGAWGTNSKSGDGFDPDTWIRDSSVPTREYSFTGIYYLVQASYTACTSTPCDNYMDGFSWYGWDFGTDGQFWNNSGSGAFTGAGIAYQNVYQWLDGASTLGPCTETTSGTNAGVWTCSFARPNGYFALAVFDTALCAPSEDFSCSEATSFTYTFPKTPAGTSYTEYRTLSGSTVSLSGDTTVSIGLEPILLDNNSSY